MTLFPELCVNNLCLDGGSTRMEGIAKQYLLGVMFSSTCSSGVASCIPQDTQCAFPGNSNMRHGLGYEEMWLGNFLHSM